MDRPESSERRALLSIDDLSLAEIGDVLESAREFLGGGDRQPAPFLAGLLFLEASLRTRVGFSAATMRLGGSVIDVEEMRFGPAMSAAESFSDTLRTLSGMVDVVVVRTPFPLERGLVEDAAVVPLVSAGDGGGEHPTQALIDMFAIEEERGPVGELRVGLCGDLRMRAALSLLKLLNRMPPRALRLMAPARRADLGFELAPALEACTVRLDHANFADLDVLYMIGLPEGEGELRLQRDARARFSLGMQGLRELPRDAVVLSPLPVIDEIARDAMRDPRVKVFQQSDRGVPVRMAVLSLLLPGG